MDSMDWFDMNGSESAQQITALNHVLKNGGRVLLRSAALKPWYTDVFDRLGFSTRRVSVRHAGSCIDRHVKILAKLLFKALC